MSEKTGAGDPLSEYGTNTMYYITQHIMEPLFRVELLADGKSGPSAGGGGEQRLDAATYRVLRRFVIQP